MSTDTPNDQLMTDNFDLPKHMKWEDEVIELFEGVLLAPYGGTTDMRKRIYPAAQEKFDYTNTSYVIKGTDNLLEASEFVKEISPPGTYKAFEDLDDIRVSATTTFNKSMYGAWGIRPGYLASIIQFFNGGGNFNPNDFDIRALDKELGLLVTFEEETFLFSYEKVSHPTDENVEAHEVNGITIENEGNKSALQGIEILMKHLPEAGIEITDFNKRTSDALYFETNKNKQLRITGNSLTTLPRTAVPPEDLAGTYEKDYYHTDDSYEYTINESDLKREMYETHPGNNLFIGYTEHVERIMRGPPENKAVVGARVTVTPHSIKLSESDDQIQAQYLRSNTAKRIETIKFDKADTKNPETFPEEYLL